jgi:O-acetylserine/cysteine efflux transporter
VAVAAVWGTNFVLIRIALDDLPPLFFAFLRFLFAFLPAALFLKRPAVPWRVLAAYGVLIGAGQFGVLFVAMRSDITPGLASLVVQTQVFFTIALAMWLSREKVHMHQAIALGLAAAGLVVIGVHTDASTTPLGLGLVLVAALSWALGNMTAKGAGSVDMLAFVVWASLFALPPLLIASLMTEGSAAISAGLAKADLWTWVVVLWQSVGNTMFGYACWAWLLARHPAAAVSPLALLVPVFGIGASALVLGEPLQPWKVVAAALVIGGLAVNLLWPTRPIAR